MRWVHYMKHFLHVMHFDLILYKGKLSKYISHKLSLFIIFVKIFICHGLTVSLSIFCYFSWLARSVLKCWLILLLLVFKSFDNCDLLSYHNLEVVFRSTSSCRLWIDSKCDLWMCWTKFISLFFSSLVCSGGQWFAKS